MPAPIEDPADAPVTPRPAVVRVLRWIAAAACLTIVLVVLLRIFIRPIPPDQAAPEGHAGEPCAVCHIVTENAEPVELP